jgi:hypothetical protein
MMKFKTGPALALGVLLLSGCQRSESPQAAQVTQGPAGETRCASYNAQRNPYFGDLHVHTTYSLDANVRGTRGDPHDAYRFATSERVGIAPYDANGQPLRTTQLARPLDFAAVTDHSEFFGEARICTHPELAGYNSPECTLYRQQPDQAFVAINFLLALPGIPQPDGSRKVPRLPMCGLGGAACLAEAGTVWGDVQAAAAQFNNARGDCSFTSFIAYEWTASPSSNNLHRNVIFGSDKVPALPISYLDETVPRGLWRDLAAACKTDAGCSYLTIPHNSDMSGGLMFQTTDENGLDFTKDYAAAKQQNEPLIEIFQHKGSSECNHTVGTGAQDELCTFENLPYDNLTADRFNQVASGKPQEKDFIRYALGEGLLQEQKLGVNPFKYGFIADTDTHNATPGNVNESAFPGHGGDGKAPADAVNGTTDFVEYNPGGLAVLWSEQNTRSSLFSAMRRREAYATSGPRMVVRFFGGWDLPMDACGGDLAAAGYAHGVAMGSDLPPLKTASARPRFAVAALKDAGAAGEPGVALQRIQIVKGWLDNGVKKEAVYDVAGNPQNGAGVDLNTCQPTGTGAASLCSVWEDTAFKPEQSAFYYARVVENPSCRWTTRQCLAAHIDCSVPANVPAGYADCCSADFPKTIQERAWTSPVWYRPAATTP